MFNNVYIISKANLYNTNFYGINISVKGKNCTQFSILLLNQSLM